MRLGLWTRLTSARRPPRPRSATTPAVASPNNVNYSRRAEWIAACHASVDLEVVVGLTLAALVALRNKTNKGGGDDFTFDKASHCECCFLPVTIPIPFQQSLRHLHVARQTVRLLGCADQRHVCVDRLQATGRARNHLPI